MEYAAKGDAGIHHLTKCCSVIMGSDVGDKQRLHNALGNLSSLIQPCWGQCSRWQDGIIEIITIND